MPSPEVLKQRRDLNKAYKAMFGYVPSPTDFACTSSDFFNALEKSLMEKKEISSFLPKRAAYIDGTLE